MAGGWRADRQTWQRLRGASDLGPQTALPCGELADRLELLRREREGRL